MTEAERIATELLMPMVDFEQPTQLEAEAAALLRKLQAENEALRSKLEYGGEIAEDQAVLIEALRGDAESYKRLRRSLVGLSFSDSLINSLCKDQSELDAAIWEVNPHE
jgi:hypothetical protein